MSAPAVSSTDPSSSDPRQPDRLHPDDQTLAQYSAVSRPALLALFLGFASALVLVSPILLVIPLAAAVVAIVALRQIAAGNGQYTGRWLATAGISLAMLFLGWGISREWTRQAVLVRHAEQHANEWLQVVRDGKLQRAHQMTHPPFQRLHSDEAIAQFYNSNQDAGQQLQSFFADEPLKSFLAMPKNGTFRFVAMAEHSRHGFTDEVLLEYEYGDPSTDAEPRHLWIAAIRDGSDRTAPPSWRIGRVDAFRNP
jgi:hypothetical protein